MVKCPNRNTKEYKDLLAVHKNPMKVDILINDWQNMTGSEEIPSPGLVEEMLGTSDVIMSLRRDSLQKQMVC